MVRRCMILGAALAVGWFCLPAGSQAQKLVFVIRHAERADGGAPQMQAQVDPPLSAAGKARAARLAAMLGDAGIQAIFVTDFRRTQDTAGPLATRLGIESQQVSSRETDALVSKLRGEHAHDIVLIVGHSNTVPAIIKGLGGPDVTIADDEYDNLFIIVPGTGAMTKVKFAP